MAPVLAEPTPLKIPKGSIGLDLPSGKTHLIYVLYFLSCLFFFQILNPKGGSEAPSSAPAARAGMPMAVKSGERASAR